MNYPSQHVYRSAEPDAGGTDTADRGDNLDPAAAASTGLSEGETAATTLREKELATKAAADAEAKDPDVEADPAAKDDPKKDSRIPRVRHEAILAKARETADELRRENAALKARKDTAAINESVAATDEAIQAMETEYATLLTDGEIAKATAKMAEIRRAERDLSVSKTQVQISSAVAQATESARYTSALDRIEAAYPALNEDHEDFDAEKMNEVILMKNGYEAQGFTPTLAMQKAVLKEMGVVTAAQTKAVTVAPRVDPKDVAAARKKDAAGKAVDAVESTPPSTTKVGLDGDKLGGGLSAKAVMNMSQKEFAGLTDEQLARMRGDTV